MSDQNWYDHLKETRLAIIQLRSELNELTQTVKDLEVLTHVFPEDSGDTKYSPIPRLAKHNEKTEKYYATPKQAYIIEYLERRAGQRVTRSEIREALMSPSLKNPEKIKVFSKRLDAVLTRIANTPRLDVDSGKLPDGRTNYYQVNYIQTV